MDACAREMGAATFIRPMIQDHCSGGRGMRKSTLALAIVVAAVAGLAACKNPFTSSGLIYNDLGEHKKAEAAFRRALEDNPKDAEALFNLGLTMTERAKTDDRNSTKTDAELAKELKIKAGQADAFRVASFDSAKVKSTEATQLYRMAAAVDSVEYGKLARDNVQSNYSYAFNKAVKFKDQERWDEASKYFDLAYAVDSEGEHGIRARTPLVQLRLSSARDELRSASDNPEAKARAVAKVEEAIKILDEIIPRAPDVRAKRSLLDNKILALRMIDRDAEAMALKEQILAETPEDVDLLFDVGQDRASQQKFQEAADYFKRAVAVVEKDASQGPENQFPLYYQLGFAYYRMSTPEAYELSIPAFQRALELATATEERTDVLERMAYCSFELEKWPQAIEYAKQVTDLDPRNDRCWQILCRAYGRNNQEDLAKPACDQYASLKSTPGS
jgi:tetratricopeptide (TPR) repeat protein